ncbi:MAG: alpha/beta fold hydrolase [Acidobacteriota bacterium]
MASTSRKSIRVHFPSAHGTQLVGRIDRPPGEPRAWALFAHCFTCSKDLKAVRWINRALVEQGLAVLRFDFTGLGESEGDFADTNFSSNLEDLVAAADYLRSEHQAPTLIVGHSLGGAAVLAAAHRMPEAQAVVTIGAPSDTEHLRHGLLGPAAANLEEGGEETTIRLAGRPFRIKRQLLEDLEADHVGPRLAKLNKALLILHSPVDETVEVDHARRIYEAARHPKSYVSLDDADHLLTRERDARYAASVIAAWADRYLPAAESSSTAADETVSAEVPAIEHGEVLVAIGPEGYATDIRTPDHPLRADEPESVSGGTNTGPNPYELLLASLGACTVMTLRMYALRKGWPLESASLRLRHQRIHRKDCEDCVSEDKFVDRIDRELFLGGDLDDAQRARLVEIADRCPVHKSLTTETKIYTTLREGDPEQAGAG